MIENLHITIGLFNEVFFMTYIACSLGMSFIGLVFSYLILKEFKIANNKQPCKFNEKYLKSLVDKIDKVIVSDKVESA